MAVETYLEQLESVQASIAKIERLGQQFDLNGRTTAFGELQTLYRREKYLRKMVARETRGGITMRQAVPRG